MPATKTLPQCAEDAIQTAIDEAADDDPVVFWWDDGGYLRDIVESVSHSFGCAFHAAGQTPLELRVDAPCEQIVPYVPQGHSDNVDWFKNVGGDSSSAPLDEEAHLSYLDDERDISALADPIQRIRNRDLSDAWFSHGGVLPQESVLNFVTITQE